MTQASMRRCVLMSILPILFCYTRLPADNSDNDNDKEISWQKASAEVEKYPFSKSYVDSLRNALDCRVPQSPLRIVQEYTIFAPETLVYSVSWGPINAGYVVLSTLYDSSANTIVISAKALSNNFVSAFYKLRDHIISTIDATGLYPVFFEQHLREGKKYKSEEYLLFDYERKCVHMKKRKKFKTIEVKESFPHDYLSVLHYLRAAGNLVPGDTFSQVVFIHSKVHSIFFTVDSSESKSVDAGTFSCVRLTPKLAGEGRTFNKKDKLELWMSNDKWRIPVAIRSKIKFGSINARLIWRNKKAIE